MTIKTLNNTVKAVKIFAIVLLFVFACILIYQFSLISNMQQERLSLKNEQEQNTALIEYYQGELDKFADSDYYNKYLDNNARENLGMAKEGETVIVGS